MASPHVLRSACAVSARARSVLSARSGSAEYVKLLRERARLSRRSDSSECVQISCMMDGWMDGWACLSMRFGSSIDNGDK